jgi:hypothetical protein
VRDVEGAGHLQGDLQRVGQAQRAVQQDLLQGAAGHVRLDQEQAAPAAAGVVQPGEAGPGQRAQDPGLVLEAQPRGGGT